MIELIGLIGALIAIGGFIWAIIRRFQPEKLKREQVVNETKALFTYGFQSWMEAPLSSKHLHLLSFEDFQKVAFYKKELFELSTDQRLYLFVCSIVHGLWGEWLPEGVASKHIIGAAATLFNGRRGWRPIWRAAYIIESLTGEDKDGWQTYVSEETKKENNFRLVAQQISGEGVISYLAGLARGENPHLLDKSYALLQEVDAHCPGKVPPEFNKANVPK